MTDANRMNTVVEIGNRPICHDDLAGILEEDTSLPNKGTAMIAIASKQRNTSNGKHFAPRGTDMKRRIPGPLYCMVVEDDTDVAKVMVNYLRDIYTQDFVQPTMCTTLGAAMSALDEAEAARRPFELVILDLALEDSSPTKTIKTWPFEKVATIAITGQEPIGLAREAIDAGACHFFAKPLRMTDFAWAAPKAVRDFRHAKITQMMETWSSKLDDIIEMTNKGLVATKAKEDQKIPDAAIRKT